MLVLFFFQYMHVLEKTWPRSGNGLWEYVSCILAMGASNGASSGLKRVTSCQLSKPVPTKIAGRCWRASCQVRM